MRGPPDAPWRRVIRGDSRTSIAPLAALSVATSEAGGENPQAREGVCFPADRRRKIVTVFDAGEEEGQLYITMELLRAPPRRAPARAPDARAATAGEMAHHLAPLAQGKG